MKKIILLLTVIFSGFVAESETSADLLQKGYSRLYEKDLKGAIHEFDRVIEQDKLNNPSSIQILNAYKYKGICLYELKNYEEAVSALSYTMEKGGNEYVDSYNYLGMCFVELKKFPEAIQILDKAIQIQTDNIAAFYWRGFAKVQSGDQSGCSDLGTSKTLGNKDAQKLIDTYCKKF